MMREKLNNHVETKLDTKNACSNRNSAVELLRILAMLMIVLSHACVHGGFDFTKEHTFFNKFIVQCGNLGNLGVDIYVIITGYFLCMREKSGKSLSKLFVQIWFYSIILFVVCWIGFSYTYSFMELQMVFFPTLCAEYWFFTAYVVLIILSPYLNILIRESTQKQLKSAIGWMVFLWVIIPTFALQHMYGSEIPQFVMFYIIGAYFRKYPDNCFKQKKVRFGIAISSFVLLFSSTFILNFLGTKMEIFQNKGTMFYGRNSLLVLGCAVGLFSIAIMGKKFYSKLINTIAGCTFGIYLIHDNLIVRKILWKEILPVANYINSPFLIFIMLGAVIVVFVFCLLIELLRQKTIAVPMTNVLDRCYTKIKGLFT